MLEYGGSRRPRQCTAGTIKPLVESLASRSDDRRGALCGIRLLEAKLETSLSAARGEVDCFTEPVRGRRFAPTRWLLMTVLRPQASRAGPTPIFCPSWHFPARQNPLWCPLRFRRTKRVNQGDQRLKVRLGPLEGSLTRYISTR